MNVGLPASWRPGVPYRPTSLLAAAHSATETPMNTHALLFAFLISTVSGGDLWFKGAQEMTGTVEAMTSGDLSVQGYQFNHTGTQGKWTLAAGLGVVAYQLDYAPGPTGGEFGNLSEATGQYSLGLTHEWNNHWSSTVNAGFYDGFSEYRSIWITEYYRQEFIGFPDGYQTPDPHGESIGASVEWDYLPGTGSAEFSIRYAHDEIAPGWSFDPFVGSPVPGASSLNTVSGNLRAEHALTGWLEAQTEVSLRKVTDRDPRIGISHGWAASVGPVDFRISGGYADEEPRYDALYGSAIVEWMFLPQWSFYTGYRLYSDSGEIQASGFNASAPALRSSEIFGGVVWDRGDLAVSAGIGFLKSDYEALGEDNIFFENLYRDRDWKTFRLSAAFKF